MAIALEAYFDAGTDAAVRGLWAAISSPLIDANARPHISLAVSADIDLAKAPSLRFDMPAALTLTFQGIGTFDTSELVVYLRCVKSSMLAEWQSRLWDSFRKVAIEPQPYYAPEAWVPHCTLTYGGAIAVPTVLAKLAKATLPEHATVTALGIVRVTPSLVTPLL